MMSLDECMDKASRAMWETWRSKMNDVLGKLTQLGATPQEIEAFVQEQTHEFAVWERNALDEMRTELTEVT